MSKLSGKKVGLALSSGGARGLAHIGVLEVLEKYAIPVDIIAGSSIGSLVGALYASGKSIAEIKDIARNQGVKRFSFLVDLSLPKTGLVRGRRIEDTIRKSIGDLEFKDLRIPFVCVATDINSGEEVVIKDGLVWKAVRASCSIPVLLAVVKQGDKYLVDGGLVNPVPVNVLKSMEADIIIAVNVMPRLETEQSKEPTIFGIIMQMLNIATYRILSHSLDGAHILIEPRVEHIAYGDFHRVDEFVEQGALATEKSITEIKKFLK